MFVYNGQDVGNSISEYFFYYHTLFKINYIWGVITTFLSTCTLCHLRHRSWVGYGVPRRTDKNKRLSWSSLHSFHSPPKQPLFCDCHEESNFKCVTLLSTHNSNEASGQGHQSASIRNCTGPILIADCHNGNTYYYHYHKIRINPVSGYSYFTVQLT